ncbi:NAD-dependent epimerase/dehydratase family protein [Rugosimonospora africana]|uniref:Dihydroflavonol-4-reductase n=1 Tax=Rugosimonospora africana TaxID=556532 RepID=A0A8J3QQL6_9ACTN|nr:NAD-dependent epimerase/dehydratase family protein [Rugosimonospora africana]GIH15645.1 dihydroflavonol-4-reductase [Rugosimonospora africana]
MAVIDESGSERLTPGGDPDQSTVLVTGGTGYIAGWCVAELLGRGYRVRTTVRAPGRQAAVTAAVSAVTDPGNRLEYAVADLTADSGWDAAMAGVDYVLHVASPLGGDGTSSAADLVVPARDGTLRVLRAAAAAGVRRVVMTSAANAASPSSYASEGVTDETLWTDPDDPTLIPYRRAKTVAEKAAWDFLADYDKAGRDRAGRDGSMSLTTILPGAVFGPILTPDNLGTTGIIARMLKGGMPGAPRIGLEVVDVRDIADIHIRAMTAPEAAGQRFLATGEFIWMRDMARALRAGLGPAAARVRTRQLPDVAVRFSARFLDPSLRAITPSLGRRNRHTTAKAERLLGWRPRPAAQTVVECGASLVERRVVRESVGKPS